VQTVDFFTPIVDDPFVYGQIAAANSVSDVYAMGGRPLTALAIAGFPESLDVAVIGEIFRGGFEKLREAGVALLGGHTVKDQELKFGYAVTGQIDPARIWSNAGAKREDVLFLTKPIGTGIVGTAIKFGRIDEAAARATVQSMRALNRAAAEALHTLPVGAVHGCTDITGFGLIGHATEMAIASDATLAIWAARVPLFDGVLDIAPQNRAGGLVSNRGHYSGAVRVARDPGPALMDLLYDPQTSGGLLVAVDVEHAGAAETALRRAGVLAARVGVVREPEADARIVVT
jgi:selenide,water dikinase